LENFFHISFSFIIFEHAIRKINTFNIKNYFNLILFIIILSNNFFNQKKAKMISKIPWVTNKTVFPQHTDHAGVMWHGSYLNWLEESRINALNQSGFKYSELLKRNFELPVIMLNINYLIPVYLNDEIIINTYFESSRSPKLIIKSEFIKKNKSISTKATINLVLLNRDSFSIVRKRPAFLEKVFKRLCEGPNQ
tara:strand:- start:2590 stop:3171 length:582 start_codon:yes stop_codon:yes gene_type:complete